MRAPTLWTASLLILAAGVVAVMVTNKRSADTSVPTPTPGDPNRIHGTNLTVDEILEPFTQRREVEAEAGATPEIQPPAVAPAPPGPRTADDPPRPKIPDEHFEGMYAGLRLDDLVLAKSRVETEFFGLQNEAVLARFEVGQYESMIRERTEGGFSSGDFTPVPSGGLINSQQTQVLESGDLEVRTTTLPYADYIHVYDRQDELFWLNRRIAELQRGDR